MLADKNHFMHSDVWYNPTQETNIDISFGSEVLTHAGSGLFTLATPS
jgi:hypothetical protein